jgi:hypothetical protein
MCCVEEATARRAGGRVGLPAELAAGIGTARRGSPKGAAAVHTSHVNTSADAFEKWHLGHVHPSAAEAVKTFQQPRESSGHTTLQQDLTL